MTERQYAAAGVDLRTAEASKERIGRLVAGTRTPLTVGAVGAFGGMVRIPGGMRRLIRAKPASSKGTYLKNIAISTTMGPGIKLDPNDLRVATKP